MAIDLLDANQSKAFYDRRYSDGYMDEWPAEKKQRVLELIRGHGLPTSGEALDFGCGTGVFAEVIQQALPHWKVSGCEISETAIKIAAKRFPSMEFFLLGDSLPASNHKFDFIFSHHVFEHVPSVADTCGQIRSMCKPGGTVLLVLPCGNEGSLEWKICHLRRNGIDTSRGNRWFFEDPGHLRRLTTVVV
jgi:2-polyprenyl-3-methyl-5-hydroxy-6-metoxy-1,4-benzoquinol methylase